MLFYQYLRVFHVLDSILIKICNYWIENVHMYNLYMYMEIHTVKYVCSVCKVSLSLSLDKLVDGQDVFFIQPTRSGKFKSCPIVNKLRGINLNMELKRQKSNLYIVCQVKQHPSLVTPKKYILKANKNWTCRPTTFDPGGVLPYMGYIGMCGASKGMDFQPFWS